MKVFLFLLAISLCLPASAVTTDWTLVGDAGNAADRSTGFGAVGYEFAISKHETTLGQYASFLNATAASDPYGLWNPQIASFQNVAGILRAGSSGSYSYSVTGSPNRPVTFVSWFDAARYANWQHNGQGSGSTETGAYTLNGAMSGIIQKNPGALVWLPSEDEWYKAAYYDPEIGATDDAENYWLHANRSNALVENETTANFYDEDYAVTQSEDYSGTQNYLTDVGAYVDQSSYYGTFDQAGNVWEWNDRASGGERGLRGTSWFGAEIGAASSFESGNDPGTESLDIGFRIAGDPGVIPEPSLLALLSLSAFWILRRRSR